MAGTEGEASAETTTVVTSQSPDSTVTTTPADATSTTTDESQFDPAAYEQVFGMEAGSLQGITDANAALAKVREYADRALIAGLGKVGFGSTTQQTTTTATKPAAETKPATGNPADDHAALIARIGQLESTISQFTTDSKTRIEQELDRRVVAEIDSWKSPKYGVGDQRGYNQIKAARELRELLATQAAGLEATGKPMPNVEQLLRSVRAFHDDTYKPEVKGAATQQVLGTPGTGSTSGKPVQAKNIHEAYMNSRR